MGNGLGLLQSLAQGFGGNYTVNPNASVDSKTGQIVDIKTGQPTTAYTQPGFFEKAFNPYADEIANLNTQMSASPLIAQQQNSIRRAVAGSNISQMPDWAKPAGVTTPQMLSMGYTGNQDPSTLAAENTQAGQMQGGIVPTQVQTGLNTATAGNNQSIFNVNQSQFALQQQKQAQQISAAQQDLDLKNVKNVAPLQYAHALSEWTAANNRQPTENERDQIIAGVQKQQAAFGANEQGLNQSTQRRQDLVANANSAFAPIPGSEYPFAIHAGDNGLSTIPGVNPDYINKMRLISAGFTQGGTSMNSFGGWAMPAKGQPIATGNYTVGNGNGSGLLGQGSSGNLAPDYIDHPKDYEPMDSNPDILINPKTGRSVYKPTGQDITQQVSGNPALVHQIAQEQNAKMETEKGNQEKVMKAKQTLEMHNFKQKQDAIAAQKQYGGLVGGLRDADQAAQDTLIGNAASWAGAGTSNLHPLNTLGNWWDKGYNAVKTGLIGQ